MHLHQVSAGFETPVLKPRASQIHVVPNPQPILSPSSHPKSPTSKPITHSSRRDKKSDTGAVLVKTVPTKRRENKYKAKKSRSAKNAHKESHPRSDTDEEQLARLKERRERKRAKREIMNPKQVKASTEAGKITKLTQRKDLLTRKSRRLLLASL
ncbi:hypothetical protein B0F90DRAFT_253124 [Multifurca ochricompacta]|uniref:Uncharacterized protein n=1 Tax=Multifurca ochricompacta TaxID=376703 RepID=A0AAD4M5D5_9AGAM|nr:hypothetical protein B0F90DRAFT_253124 [Multifurca ochricompacta]